jgi:hypothetical protein
VKLLKQEDAGAIYANRKDLKVPDYRAILADDSQLLVEVKNFRSTQPFCQIQSC